MIKPTCAVSFAIIVFISSISSAAAQLNLSKWQVGINGGIFVYQGDLTPSPIGSYRTLSSGFGLYISRVLSPSFILRTNVARGTIKGNDGAYLSPWWRKERNFRFSSTVTEFSELVVWNIFKNNGNQSDRRFSPYMYVGAGVSLLNIKRDYSNMNKSFFYSGSEVAAGLATDMATKPPSTILVLPAGLGVEYYVSPKISVTAETAFRYIFTDYLDGFSKAANPKRKDFYHSHTFGVVYKFGKKDPYRCPVAKL